MSINFSGEYSNSGGGGHPISFLDARYLNTDEEIAEVTALTNRVRNIQSQLSDFGTQLNNIENRLKQYEALTSRLNSLSARLTTLERLLEDHTHRIGVFQNFQVRSAVLHDNITEQLIDIRRHFTMRHNTSEGRISVLEASKPKGVKDSRGFIPLHTSIREYTTLGISVNASSSLVTPYNVLIPGRAWGVEISPHMRQSEYIEIQLPESIRIWRFSILGNQSESKNQPKSITLMAGNEAIFTTLDADLTPNRIKYFEVQTQNKYSKYRLQISSATSGSDRIVIQSIQLYAVLDLVT